MMIGRVYLSDDVLGSAGGGVYLRDDRWGLPE